MADEFFTIKKNVPAPIQRASKLAPIYPFNAMSEGDCFDMPISENEPPRKAQARVLAAFHTYRRRHPERWGEYKLTTLYVAEEKLVRVWLLKRDA